MSTTIEYVTNASVLIRSPDNSLVPTLYFSTSQSERFFNGVLPQDTIKLEVSINGSGFSDDPSLAVWGDGVWTVPNPAYEPNGQALFEGINTIEIRATTLSGSYTNTAHISATLSSTSNLGVLALPPTNISIDQKNNSVVINAEPQTTSNFIGMNFYASLNAGGGISGYIKINSNIVNEGNPVEELTKFGTESVDTTVKVDSNGNQVADPMYLRVAGSQEDSDEKTLQSDFSTRFEIPENATKLRVSFDVNSVRSTNIYQFEHNRNADSTSNPPTVSVGDFASLSPEEPLYYAVTALYYDPDQKLEFESSFSQEVSAHPISVTTAIGSFPTTTRQTIVQEYIKAIFRSNPQIKVEAGSVLRDTVIDPFSSEVERIRFILDFYQRARTPTLLLQIDDPNGTGTSVPVSQSSYKQGLQQAFYLSSATDTQNLIDSAFDAYASNFGVLRRSGVSARGEVTFFTTIKPTSTILIPLGTTVSGGSAIYSTTSASSISLQNLASFFNPVTGRYQVTVPVRCNTIGSIGNIGTGQIRRVVSTLGGSISVVNSAPMVGGRDGESNLILTERVLNSLASVDSGTEKGYLKTAADVPGVVRANVVSSGDPLMQRDLNENGVHKGGKVDVWIQGDQSSTVTDVFAFAFDISRDIQFEVIGDVTAYNFRALDPTLSEENPIVEMLDDVAAGYSFVNASTGFSFDISGITYPTYNTIQLDISIPQPPVDLADVLLGSFRKRSGNKFTFIRQPVNSVISVIGTNSGTLPSSAYKLVTPNPPLEFGNSSLAGDFLEIVGYTNALGNKIPSGTPIQIVSESHVLIGSYPEFVDNLGANFLTVKVYNSNRTVEYRGPNHPSGNPDYQITLGTETKALSITRVEGGQINTGDTVLIDYQHDENFTVTYDTDLIISLVQQEIDQKKHVTADVLCKKAIRVPLDIEATVVFVRGRDSTTVDNALRTNIENFFSNLRLGDPVRQSDVVRVIENTEGVSYVVVPFVKMVRQQGSQVVREEISTDTAAESKIMSSLTTNRAVVYLLVNPLSSATENSGGSADKFRGVFQDDIELDLLPSSSTLSSLGVSAGRSYIIGSAGASISGYSDDTTLESQGYTTEEEKLARRKQLTANRVLVSLNIGKDPTEYKYAVTYIVGEDSGAKDIDPGKAEYCVSGNILFTYDEDQ